MLGDNWFSEPMNGYAISLEITSKLHDEQSDHQHIEVFETRAFGRLLTLDGLTMLTSRDNFIYHEMLVHPAMFTHVEPKTVVIIGGGDCGALREVLKHPAVVEVWQIELDERVTRVCEEYFPELSESNDHASANFFFGDGVDWLAQRAPASIDVLILDTTDPVGQAARLFSVDFYRDCFNALDETGVLVAQSGSPLMDLDLIRSMQANMRAAGLAGVATLTFPQPTYPSGWWSATLARKGGQETEFRESDARTKSFATQYYNAAIHRAAFAVPEFMHLSM